MPDPRRIERRAGAGSRSDTDDEYEADSFRHDERADTETTFFESDIQKLRVSERRKQQLRDMLKRQEGSDQFEPSRSGRRSRNEQNREEWKRRVADTYCAQAELTRAQKERVKHLVLDVLDIQSFGPYAAEEIVIATINVVAREQGRWIEDEEQFRDLAADAGVEVDGRPDMQTLKRLRRLVRDRI